MNTQFKEQQCNVVGLALGWIAYPVGIGYFTYQHQWAVMLLWLAGMPGLRWALYHFFPRISPFLGYGRIADTLSSMPPLRADPKAAPVAVTFYSFFSCPFCPIVLARLQALQKQMGFALTLIDVTLKPQTLMTKGIRSVPVVEVGDDRLVGNSTTEQLAELIAGGQTPELVVAAC
jgi:glutaredoxin